jgi:hypothetical protein
MGGQQIIDGSGYLGYSHRLRQVRDGVDCVEQFPCQIRLVLVAVGDEPSVLETALLLLGLAEQIPDLREQHPDVVAGGHVGVGASVDAEQSGTEVVGVVGRQIDEEAADLASLVTSNQLR